MTKANSIEMYLEIIYSEDWNWSLASLGSCPIVGICCY
jgi:hypothetical protein